MIHFLLKLALGMTWMSVNAKLIGQRSEPESGFDHSDSHSKIMTTKASHEFLDAMRMIELHSAREILPNQNRALHDMNESNSHREMQTRLLQASTHRVRPNFETDRFHSNITLSRILQSSSQNYDYNAYYGNFYYRNFDQTQRDFYDFSEYTPNFNLSDYSLKYVGCSNVKTWSDDLAGDDSAASPLALHQYVVLRLCEHDHCSAYNQYGCNYQYGEYLLPLADYLAILTRFHLQQYQRYCAVCTECLTWKQQTTTTSNDDYYSDGDISSSYGYGDNDDLSNGYNYGSGGGYNRNLGYSNSGYSGSSAGNRPWFIQNDGSCLFSTVCTNYTDVCASYSESTPSYQSFLQCSAFNVGNMVGYVGPHCRSDGRSIGIGLFADENCHNYLGDEVHIGQYLNGGSYDADELAPFYQQSCISCSTARSDGQYVLRRNSNYTSYDNGNSQNGNQNLNVYPLCNQIYWNGAKCNRHLPGFMDTYTVSSNESD
jgi:hypothetical protein